MLETKVTKYKHHSKEEEQRAIGEIRRKRQEEDTIKIGEEESQESQKSQETEQLAKKKRKKEKKQKGDEKKREEKRVKDMTKAERKGVGPKM